MNSNERWLVYGFCSSRDCDDQHGSIEAQCNPVVSRMKSHCPASVETKGQCRFQVEETRVPQFDISIFWTTEKQRKTGKHSNAADIVLMGSKRLKTHFILRRKSNLIITSEVTGITLPDSPRSLQARRLRLTGDTFDTRLHRNWHSAPPFHALPESDQSGVNPNTRS